MMRPAYVDRALLEQFLARLGAALARPARLFLVGETSQVFEGWREWTKRVEFAAEVAPGDRAAFDETLREVSVQVGVEVFEESPGDVIPLPAGYESRARAAGIFGALQVYHFDPYSVAFRLIARGDEPDYHAVLAYLEHGWLRVDEMNALLVDLLPQFTSETIQQDPAEFRRKYKGLLQMWRAAQAA
jgi:hypothetical protein